MINRILGGLGRTLIFAGVVLLLFVAHQLWGTKLDEESHQEDLTRSLGASLGVTSDSGGDAADEDPAVIDKEITTKLAAIDPVKAPPAEIPKEGDPEGKIEIPKIGLRSKTFVEGVAKADLRKGPGHYPGTPLPGNAGNAAIAGHRSTYGAPFNRIDELQVGDDIIVYTLQGKFTYKVMPSPEDRRSGKEGGNWGQGWFAVTPNDVSVLLPIADKNTLTLTACHPKYSAKLRIIVHAELVAEPATAPTTTVPPETSADSSDAEDSETVTSPTQDAEDLIAGDPKELTPALLFGAVVIALWLGSMAFAAWLRKGARRAWPVYVVTVASTVAPLWFCFVHMDRFLPSY